MSTSRWHGGEQQQRAEIADRNLNAKDWQHKVMKILEEAVSLKFVIFIDMTTDNLSPVGWLPQTLSQVINPCHDVCSKDQHTKVDSPQGFHKQQQETAKPVEAWHDKMKHYFSTSFHDIMEDTDLVKLWQVCNNCIQTSNVLQALNISFTECWM